MIAHAYVRRSTSGQALSPEAQRQAIESWAAREGVSVASWHVEEPMSGRTPIEDRPALLGALGALSRGSVLVCAKWDRLARDVVIAATIERIVEKAGARIVSADGVGNGSRPEDGLMRAMVAAFSAYERALIAARTKAALAARRAKGLSVSRFAPYGFRHGEGGELVPVPDEQAAIERARELAACGLTYREIGQALHEEGHRPRGKAWRPSAVACLLRA